MAQSGRNNRSFIIAMFLLVVLAGAAWYLHGPLKVNDGSAVASATDKGIVTMIAINDVYRIEGINDGKAGGLSRVAWLRQHAMAKTGAPVPLLHAGDVLSPSLYSLQGGFNGAEMVDVMNALDGAPAAFDPYFFTAVGNHEFDKTKCLGKGLGNFSDRVRESGFTWLSGNLDYSECEGWAPEGGKGKLADRAIFTVKGMTFGVFGLTVEFEPGKEAAARKGPQIDGAYIKRARELTAQLRAEGAEFVIGVTHLPWACDLKILKDLENSGPDLIMGGHDHVRMVHTSPENFGDGKNPYRAVYKASSDATDLAMYDFWRQSDGKIAYSYSARDMDMTAPKSATIDTLVQDWEAKLDQKICGADTGCLDRPVGTTAYPWKLLEHENRSGETRVGNWYADLMLEAAKDDGSFCESHQGVVSLINSGTFRLNYDIPTGAQLLDKHVRGVMPYGAKLSQLCVPGSMLHAGLVNGLSAPGAGRYPHIGGMRVSYHRGSDGVAVLDTLATTQGDAIKNDDTRYLLITASFLASNSDDGYLFHTVPEGERKALEADLLTIVPARLGDQAMTPAITPANQRKKELPGQTPSPSCKI
ncbi:MAG: 5'-nucleotidase C-terminal domain-containing protein [Alphaproteobacteria bacterium]|nr:5'-nucleotidase C-terminal domain-containing protein [Alphaproteobacteria bacterium]